MSVLVLVVAGCGNREQGPEVTATKDYVAKPLEKKSSGKATLFTHLDPETCGLVFTNPINTAHPLKRLYAGGYAVGGIAIGDVNGDDLPDVYCVSGPGADKLFVQTAPLTFEDVTAASGIGDTSAVWGTGAAMADMDGDGDLDLYVCRYDSPNALFINDGRGHFEDRAETLGAAVINASLMPSFVDYDNDGDLDLYVMTNTYYREGGMPRDATFMIGNEPSVKAEYRQWIGIRPAGTSLTHKRYELYPVGQRDVLLKNEDGVYKDVSGYAGDIGVHPGKGLSATWWDYNEDGYPDLYVCNDFEDSDRFYHNNGDGTFTDIIKSAMPHTTWYSMGADVADFNQDGRLDLLALDMAATTHFKQKTSMGDMSSKQLFMKTAEPRQVMRNSLFLNTGTGRFQEAAYLAGLASSDWSWAAKAADFDNDGLTDVFVSNGMSRAFTNSDILREITYSSRFGKTDWELFADQPPQKEANLAFVNRGDLRFEETAKAWGLDHVGMSYSTAMGDLDRDGDLDLVVANLDEPIHVYRNDSQNGNSLLIELRGSAELGARLVARVGARTLVRQVNPYTGFLSSNDPTIHFGLGDAEKLDALTIHWPGGSVQTIKDLSANQHVIVTKPNQAHKPTKPEVQTWFTKSDLFGDLRHRELLFDDFERQPLLPNQLSQLGPGIAMADVNGDGLEDLYLSGAAGLSGSLHLRNGSPIALQSFAPTHASEDMTPLFFDANGDGHTDLYVVSGGVECEPGAEVLRDRLYRGNGAGRFIRDSRALPDLRDSGGAAAAADFDQDGDIDLFVGGRVIPGQYPLSPKSRLLVNDGGRFTDQTPASLLERGMVTATLWVEVNGDKGVDLVVAFEWGPIRVFRNHQGNLTESLNTGITDLLGWWNGLAAGDVDGDGDMDLAATNVGLNTKYHASKEHPALLYYGDFENSGRMRLVEAEFEDETLFPIRGKSCSTAAMPHLAHHFPTFQEFAAASLERIYRPDALTNAHRFEANTLDSGIFLNDGKGAFVFRPLPRLAQIAPGQGVTLTDFDDDGHLDLYMLQNFFGPQLETGRMDGGVSQLMQGDGSGNFTLVPPEESGLVVSGDGRALLVRDLNQDGKPDLVTTQNDGPVQVFMNQR